MRRADVGRRVMPARSPYVLPVHLAGPTVEASSCKTRAAGRAGAAARVRRQASDGMLPIPASRSVAGSLAVATTTWLTRPVRAIDAM